MLVILATFDNRIFGIVQRFHAHDCRRKIISDAKWKIFRCGGCKNIKSLRLHSIKSFDIIREEKLLLQENMSKLASENKLSFI